MDFLPAVVMWVTVAMRRGWSLQTRGGFRQEPNAGKTLGVETGNAAYF